MTTDIRVIIQDYDFERLRDMPDDQIVEIMRGVVEAHDQNRFALGDTGAEYTRRNGRQSMESLLQQIGAKLQKPTLYEYIQVARFYPPPIRETIRMCSWSHMRVAMRYKDVEQAIDALKSAYDNGINIREFTAQVNADTGRESNAAGAIYQGDAAVIMQEGDIVTLKLLNLPPSLGGGDMIHIVISELQRD